MGIGSVIGARWQPSSQQNSLMHKLTILQTRSSASRVRSTPKVYLAHLWPVSRSKNGGEDVAVERVDVDLREERNGDQGVKRTPYTPGKEVKPFHISKLPAF